MEGIEEETQAKEAEQEKETKTGEMEETKEPEQEKETQINESETTENETQTESQDDTNTETHVEEDVPKRLIPMSEVCKHGEEGDCWLVIDQKVYDVSAFVEQHPGGAVILDGGGMDATSMFQDVGHSGDALSLLETLYIGDLAP